MDEASALPHGPPINILPPSAAGLDALYTLCRKIYPEQINPLQVTALLKYWLGGPDPLDYISMYANSGCSARNIPPHWHYISFGLSDLHGDGRVHEVQRTDGVSGFGFELTFRLKREPSETAPPTWPATLMQSLAKYVFQSGNALCAGDHVSWHCALDNNSDSRIQHMLMTTDAQLKCSQTPFGNVDFVQIVGVCAEELKAAQQWNGTSMLEMLTRLPNTGGLWHITDMRRGESIFELDVGAQEEVERGFETNGSNLSGVSARCSWTEYIKDDNAILRRLNANKGSTLDGPNSESGSELRNEMHLLESTELMNIKKLDGVHIIFNLEAGSLLPLAIRGRVKHGRHFTYKSVIGETAITLVANTVTGTLVDIEHPYVAQGTWLQILISDDLMHDMISTFQVLTNPQSLSLPKTFSWPDRKLSVTIVSDKV